MQNWNPIIYLSLLLMYLNALFPICIVAQAKSNPFEVKPRLKEIAAVDTTLLSGHAASLGTGIIKSDSIGLSTDSSKIGSTSNAIIGKNPFEVDHVPIRRSIVDKKTDDIRSIAESTKGSTRFLFLFLMVAGALLAIVLGTNRKIITLLSRALVNENMLKLFYREEVFKPATVLLYLIFIINFAAFIYLISAYYGGPSGIYTYGIIALILIGLYILRHLSLFLLGKIFGISKSTGLYSFTIMVFNHYIGLVLIPINLFLALGPGEYRYQVLICACIILALLYLLRTFRSIFIVSEYFIERIFQIFVYLCAFEIVPVLIILKTISNFVE